MSTSGGKARQHDSESWEPDYGRDHAEGDTPARGDDANKGHDRWTSPKIVEYAPKHVRERFALRAIEEAAPPRPPAGDEPAEPADDDEHHDAPLVPDPPHEGTPYDNVRGGDAAWDLDAARGRDAAWDRDDPIDEEPYARGDDPRGTGAPRGQAVKTEFDEDFAHLAALLQSIRRGEPPPPRRTAGAPPLAAAHDTELEIDGLRVPPSLRPAMLLPPEPGESGLTMVISGAVASLVAAAAAYVIVAYWPAPAPPAAAQLPLAAMDDRAPAAADPPVVQPVVQEAVRAAPLTSAPARYEVASTAPAVATPPAVPVRPSTSSPAATPPAVPVRPPTSSAAAGPRAVPVVRVAPPWPTDAPGAAPASTPALSFAPQGGPTFVPQARPTPAPQPRPTPAPQARTTPAPQAPLAPPPQAAPSPSPTIEAQEIELLLKQGKQFVAVGDLATARTVLQRAADAGVAAGAFALAETYDPAVLAKLGVRGLQGDVDEARRWYARAQELGSDEAARRLALIAEAGNTPGATR